MPLLPARQKAVGLKYLRGGGAVLKHSFQFLIMLVIHQGISLTFQTCFVKIILTESSGCFIKQKKQGAKQWV